MTSAGGVPRALAISFTLGWASATSICGVAVASVQPRRRMRVVLLLGQLGHALVGQDLLGELEMALGHHLAQLVGQVVGVHVAHALVLAGDHDVDAVGGVADVLVDPGQLDLELLGA